MKKGSPKRVVCLTEEGVETLHLLGLLDRVVGVSVFVKRPKKAQKIKKISSFIKANASMILDLKPDLVLGYSDIQKTIAEELVGHGLSVWIANHRSVEGICNYVIQLGSLFVERPKALKLVSQFEKNIAKAKAQAKKLKKKPRVYFEEWNDPMIFGIEWVSEVIEICGGKDIFIERRGSALATDRKVTPEEVRAAKPDIVLSCWCGEPMDKAHIENRLGKEAAIYGLPPEIFLQPGPAVLTDGLKDLSQLFLQWSKN